MRYNATPQPDLMDTEVNTCGIRIALNQTLLGTVSGALFLVFVVCTLHVSGGESRTDPVSECCPR